MLFPTLTFGLFFLAVYALVWTVGAHDNEWRKILLLVASWVFYGAWDWRFVALLIASAFINWGLGQLIAHAKARAEEGEPARHAKALVTLGVVANLSILGFFKYFDFFLSEIAPLVTNLGFARDLPLLQIVLPVGVSFFTFQGMSYMIDVYRGRTRPASLLDITLLMSFFPHLVAGPIVRAAHLVPQFQRSPKMDRGVAAMALLLIIWGLFKKAVIASELSTQFVDPVFFDPSAYGSADLVFAAYGYAVQIYCDFSAYSDMAIGLAALLGYRFPRNFDQPYRAASLQDFWRRWHMSLSAWLRDYLYIGLGGNRGGLFFVCRNLMITMLLGGIWHGAKWTFLIWGGLHGLVLSAERVWRDVRPGWMPSLPRPIGIFVTFHIVVLGWIFFRAETFVGAIAFIKGIAAWHGAATMITPLGLALVLLGLSMHFGPPRLMQGMALRLRFVPAPLLGLMAGAAILIIDAMRFEGVAPFIYYQF
jgi:D-alanyl-lipoteichoic acid acyltransferase DltB (MBOAT superfamily)